MSSKRRKAARLTTHTTNSSDMMKEAASGDRLGGRSPIPCDEHPL
jgi:hypothetical protein